MSESVLNVFEGLVESRFCTLSEFYAMNKIGNPAWSRGELILALDLYLRNKHSIPGKMSSEVSELSDLLNKMGTNSNFLGSPTYRNANGVYMKLMNFRSLDPEYTKAGKVGLSQVGRRDKEVWAEFGHDPEGCSKSATEIRELVAAGRQVF